MPDVRPADQDPAIAVLCSDLHLSIKPPVARSVETDWHQAMGRQLEWLDEFAGEKGGLPIIYAGDVFDKWNTPPELINFALEHLPKGFAVPGNHDLPEHNPSAIQRSAFGVLVGAGKLTLIDRTGTHVMPSLMAYGFGCGVDLIECPDKPHTFVTRLAVVHQFVWTKSTGYEGAPEEALVLNVRKKLKGYDAAVFGDNHKGFLSRTGHSEHLNLFNCGAFLRRRIDEKDYAPQVGLLHSSGEIEPYKIPCDADKFIEVDHAHVKTLEKRPDLESFIQEIMSLTDAKLDFEEAVKRFFHGNLVNDRVKEIILKSMEKRP